MYHLFAQLLNFETRPWMPLFGHQNTATSGRTLVTDVALHF
jgi:hypothetical protein